MRSTSLPARSPWTAERAAPYCCWTPAIDKESVTARPWKPSRSRSTPLTIARDIDDGTWGSTARTSMWPTITAGRPARTADAKGTRSTASSCSRVRVWTGRVRWLSCGTDPWPGKCLSTGTTADRWIPSAAASTWALARRGSEPAERDPIVGSPGPEVTSASGAKTTSKPSPRSSAALARWAAVVTCGSRAAPADMKVGKRVASPLTRSTIPPSWSTDRNSGHGRRTARVQRRVDRAHLPGRGHVVGERDHPAQVQAADHRHRGGGAAPLRDDHLAGQVGQRHPAHLARGALQLGTGRPPALDQSQPLGGSGRGGGGRRRLPLRVAGSSAGPPLHAEAASARASSRGTARRGISSV